MKKKKAVVVGGSNGIGLAISLDLINKGFFVEILDREEPKDGFLSKNTYHYIECDLLDCSWEQFSSLAADSSVKLLMITAGIGRIADFEYIHSAEIEKIVQVDTIAAMKIFRAFYERIMDKEPFYAGVMGSIAGWICTPSAAVYAGAKAGIVRFVESVNIELEMSGTQNRILDVSPMSFEGSRFYGKENRPALLNNLASQIVQHLYAHSTRFIPQYEDTLKGVMERYQNDPHGFGVQSYQYKRASARLDNQRRVQIGYLSGTFDLFHIGHLNLLKRAKKQCDYLIVGVHGSGAWKGKETFIPFEERLAIIESCKYVDKAVKACDEDSDAWEIYRFDRLFVGSDYRGSERFNRYEAFFADKNVKIIYFPYTQSTSSTQIRKTVLLKTKDIKLDRKS